MTMLVYTKQENCRLKNKEKLKVVSELENGSRKYSTQRTGVVSTWETDNTVKETTKWESNVIREMRYHF